MSVATVWHWAAVAIAALLVVGFVWMTFVADRRRLQNLALKRDARSWRRLAIARKGIANRLVHKLKKARLANPTLEITDEELDWSDSNVPTVVMRPHRPFKF